MASWLFVALHVWDALTNDGRTVFFISKKEEDAGFGNDLSLLARAQFIIDHLPDAIKPRVKKGVRPPCITFPGRYSSIFACSQDAESLRQYTASRILSDEMAFQERADKAYTAMKPTIDGGGCLTGISTPNGRHNLFYHLVHDIKKGEKGGDSVGVRKGLKSSVNGKTLAKGLSYHKNRNGFTVISLHRSANPARGEDWAKKMQPTYASVDDWKQEQELDFTKSEGQRVYPSFRADRHVRSLNYNPWRTIWRGWDFGYNHPAVLWLQIDEYDRVCILKELLGEEVVINVFAREVQKITEECFPGCNIKDAGDPAGRAKSDKSERSTVDILRSLRPSIKVHMSYDSVKDGVNCIRGLLLPRADDNPGLLVDPSCEILIDSFLGGYIRNEKDEPVKDGYFDHLMDALRYFVNVNFDVRTYRPYQIKGVYIPTHKVIDPVTGF
jgi:hypothetical protein